MSDACSLLSPGELQASLHGTVSPGDLTASPDGHESICEWTVTTGRGGGYSVQLDVKSPFTAGDFRQQRRVASGATKTVRRLGDAAFAERAPVAGQVYDDLWVHAGSVAFRLEALKDLGAGPLVPLARTVLAGLAGAPTP